MAKQNIILGGFVDEEVKKLNENFNELYEQTSAIPNSTSDLDNDSGFTTTAAVEAMLVNYVPKETGKGLSSNDFTAEEKAKLAGLSQIQVVNFAESEWTTAADGYKNLNLSAEGKKPIKVYRQSGSDYEEALVHTKISGETVTIIAEEAFAGYVVAI